jgi:hypothetical protein
MPADVRGGRIWQNARTPDGGMGHQRNSAASKHSEAALLHLFRRPAEYRGGDKTYPKTYPA